MDLLDSLRILRIQYMIGSVFSFSMILKPKCLVYSVLSSIISSQLLLALQLVLCPCPIATISFNITSASYCLPITATLLDTVFQGVQDSSDIFLSDTNLPLSDCLSFPLYFLHFFSNLWSLVPYN